MNKFSKITEWLYLGVAGLFVVEIFVNYPKAMDKVYLSAFMTLLAIFMFFFKRRFRKNQSSK